MKVRLARDVKEPWKQHPSITFAHFLKAIDIPLLGSKTRVPDIFLQGTQQETSPLHYLLNTNSLYILDSIKYHEYSYAQ